MKINKITGIIIASLIILLIITACQEQAHEQHMPQAPIAVEFFTEPVADIRVGEEVQLFVEVTQEGEAVSDAHPVRFEIWHEEESEAEATEENGHSGHGQDHGNGHHEMENWNTIHEMLDGEHIEGGVYGIHYTFEKEGLYYVMYHVDARGFHAMTRHEVIVQP